MSYGARRLNRSPLRPQLRAKKQASDSSQENASALLPGDSTGNSEVTLYSSENASKNDPWLKRVSQTVRPGFGNRHFGPADSTTVEGEWEQAEENSSASFWGMVLVAIIVLAWGAAFIVGFEASLAFLLAIGLVFVIAGLVSPALGLLAVGMVAALDAMANIFLLTGGLLRYNTINYVLLFVILINLPFVLRLKDFTSRALQLLLLVMTIGLFYSEDINNGLQDILNIAATFGIVIFFAKALKDDLSLYWLGIVNGVLGGLGGLVFILQKDSLPYANPNDWTYFPLTALFSICISYPFAVKYHKSRLILLFLAAVNFTWIFLSASRGSLLVAIIAGAFLFLSTRSITWKTIMVVIAIGTGVWISASFAEQQITTVTRVEQLFDPNLSPTRRTSQRSVIADAGWQIFQRKPLLGEGTGDFDRASRQTGLVRTDRPAHSAWIQVLAENGILGILFMTLFVVSYALVGLKRQNNEKLLFALFITLTLASAFIAKEFRGKSLWLLAASGIVLLQPKALLAYIQEQGIRSSRNAAEQIRRVRFGRRK